MIAEILFASGNKGKISEIREIASEFPSIKILAPLELSEVISKNGSPPDVVEDGVTYEENAALKSRAFFAWSNIPSLADDAGLEVLALNGAPGVISARYAGEPSNAQNNIDKLLKELSGVKDRRAKFVSFLNLKISDRKGEVVEIVAQASLEGEIALVPSGAGGFGYDPIFIPTGHKESLSALKERGIKVPTHRILSTRKLFTELKRQSLLK